MAAVLIALGFYLVYPVLLIIIYTFNTAFEVFVGTPEWGLDNWRSALSQPGIMTALWNSYRIWGMTVVISLPVAVVISWVLARTTIPFSHGLEFMFWVSYMMPGWLRAKRQLSRPHSGVPTNTSNAVLKV